MALFCFFGLDHHEDIFQDARLELGFWVEGETLSVVEICIVYYYSFSASNTLETLFFLAVLKTIDIAYLLDPIACTQTNLIFLLIIVAIVHKDITHGGHSEIIA